MVRKIDIKLMIPKDWTIKKHFKKLKKYVIYFKNILVPKIVGFQVIF